MRSTRREFLLAASTLALVAALSGGGLELLAKGAFAQSAAEAELMQPGPLGDEVMGDDKAPVTIIEYASMTCPHCANFAINTFPQLKEKYIDTGKVRYILREFPFDPSAEAGFMLARCAKDNYFPMVDVLFKQQANWVGVSNTKDALLQISKLAGFTQESFEACLTDQKLLDDVRSVQKRGASEFKVDSTPTFFVNGTKLKGGASYDDFKKLIDPNLKS